MELPTDLLSLGRGSVNISYAYMLTIVIHVCGICTKNIIKLIVCL